MQVTPDLSLQIVHHQAKSLDLRKRLHTSSVLSIRSTTQDRGPHVVQHLGNAPEPLPIAGASGAETGQRHEERPGQRQWLSHPAQDGKMFSDITAKCEPNKGFCARKPSFPPAELEGTRPKPTYARELHQSSRKTKEPHAPVTEDAASTQEKHYR